MWKPMTLQKLCQIRLQEICCYAFRQAGFGNQSIQLVPSNDAIESLLRSLASRCHVSWWIRSFYHSICHCYFQADCLSIQKTQLASIPFDKDHGAALSWEKVLTCWCLKRVWNTLKRAWWSIYLIGNTWRAYHMTSIRVKVPNQGN